MSSSKKNVSAIPKSTCLSSEEHGCNIKDHLLHYIGCIEYRDREDFFNENSQIWKDEVEHQEKVLGHSHEEAYMLTELKRNSWKADCENELSRIGFLRRELFKNIKDKHLVCRIQESLGAWRVSPINKVGILIVESDRRAKGKGNSQPFYVSPRDEEYDPEKDVTVPIIQFNEGKRDELRDHRVWNRFPNQKTTLSSLLNDQDSLLQHDNYSSDRVIRYFHIPSNNMDWVERAIGRYFGEERPNYHTTHRELNRKKKTKADMVLRNQYWRGQLRGNQPHNPAHARHMKPLCATISSEDVKYFHRNMVLFMPYLHWETSRNNDQFSMETEEKIAEERLEGIDNLYSQRIALPRAQRKSMVKVATMSTLLKLMKEKCLIKSRLEVDHNGRLKIRHPLGQLLLDAARLYEGMSNYRDKKLLRQYLSANPPLHPRRTLYQAHHGALHSTWERDRDQVVYKHTTAQHESFHKYNPETSRWEGHMDFDIGGKCEECNRNIRKVSRVVMVDQLWMWILDAKTIITCFPNQYGSNRQDSSAVHESIRDRIQEVNPEQIRTVFDLGLIIIEACVGSLFNRPRVTSLQPQVIDVFSKAIGNAIHKQTIISDRLWRWARDARQIYNSNWDVDTLELMTLIDIYPEGQLELDLKDIVEELDIMIHITKVHKEMIAAFTTNAQSLLGPIGRFGDSIKSKITDHHSLSPDKDDMGDNKSLVMKGPEDYNWFKLGADELQGVITGRIEELEELRSAAHRTAESVKYQLGFKQQHASVIQAWVALHQSDETIKQGRSVMMFTLVTIIFLPLSFMSSVFGMNNIEITSETWSIHREFLYMFTISAAVIILSLLLAFGGWICAGLFYLWKRFIAALMVESGLYNRWRDASWPSKKFQHEANVFSDPVKSKARKAHLVQTVKKRLAEEERAKAMQGGIGNGISSSGSLSEQEQGNCHVDGYSSQPPNQPTAQPIYRRIWNGNNARSRGNIGLSNV
ncbi:hypothetical protein F4813DRAFT_374522 [Daldinia decipiens]|uniref:uncharacterized protein n=1 Tax=Daldinia decipiens TaxID=326647 RepID=UPI0020C28DB6|nr:uncharacterized protein F4813DRAFT_374522 [Daldinia decipiens]KAI1653377.1 hypothetical protein F4813DRAFT_374522 [Daldinia decipiens]